MQRLEGWLLPAARRLWPGIDNRSPLSRQQDLLALGMLVYALPLAAAGLIWLVFRTDLDAIREGWPLLLALLSLLILARRLDISRTHELTPGMTIVTEETTEDLFIWSTAFLFGASGLWVVVIARLITYTIQRRRQITPGDHWNLLRNVALDIGANLIGPLLALSLYARWGGRLPLPGLELPALAAAFGAAALAVLLELVIYTPLLARVVYLARTHAPEARPLPILARTLSMWFWLTFLLSPVGVFIAGLYAHSGPVVFFFFIGMVLVGSAIGSQLSQMVEHNRQRSRELERLERLGRAMFSAPLDGSLIPALLDEHLPGMFSQSRIEIHLYPGRTLARLPADWPGIGTAAWDWFRRSPGTHLLPAGSRAPWGTYALTRHVLLVPLITGEEGPPAGGLCIMRRGEGGPLDALLPAAQTLAAQIASALQRIASYRETLEHQRTVQELAIAGDIQSSFLPRSAPQIEGWQVSATLQSARETSGDFFDLIPLWDGRLGLVVADVADKGMGAALYMALTRTLIRTYVTEYSTRYPDNYSFHPERVLNTVNQCMMQDAQSDLFVTVFFGILDPRLATLTYANAGHNPPLLFSASPASGDPACRALTRTGIPLGIFDDTRWERGSVHFESGDLLVLFSDGLIDATDMTDEPFGEGRLIEVIQAHRSSTARELRTAIIDEVQMFVGAAPRFDDLTLMVLRREPEDG